MKYKKVLARQSLFPSTFRFPVLLGLPVWAPPALLWENEDPVYMHERGAYRREGFGQARRDCLDRVRWRLFCCGHPLWKVFPESKGRSLIKR